MRIAQICPPWFSVPPKGYGGIEWVVALLADGLTDLGHDVTLFAPGGSETKAKLISEFEDPPGGTKLGQFWYEVIQAASAYRYADDFDVIHDHCGMIGPPIGANVSKPVVHTLHGPFTEMAKQMYRLLAPSKDEPGRHVRNPLHVVAISNSQRSGCPDLNYAGMVYNGIDLNRYPFKDSKEDYVLFLGRVNKEKGPEIAIDVAARAGVKLKMAVKMSESFEQVYWKEVVEPRLTGNEEIIGEITVEEKASLIANAKATLFPIQWPEPFGLVMTESMAAGTPVLAFPYGSAPEVIADGKTGFLCKEVDDMVSAISRVSSIDPRECRRRVEEKFSARTMCEGYQDVYERVLAR
ncbi:MAG: glycosyltransferase family 4 protein [Actinomycetota bacterium]